MRALLNDWFIKRDIVPFYQRSIAKKMRKETKIAL